MADTLAFEHQFTSGVISWAPEDEPTDAQIEPVLDAFEETAWAGLEPDRRHMCQLAGSGSSSTASVTGTKRPLD